MSAIFEEALSMLMSLLESSLELSFDKDESKEGCNKASMFSSKEKGYLIVVIMCHDYLNKINIGKNHIF